LQYILGLLNEIVFQYAMVSDKKKVREFPILIFEVA